MRGGRGKKSNMAILQVGGWTGRGRGGDHLSTYSSLQYPDHHVDELQDSEDLHSLDLDQPNRGTGYKYSRLGRGRGREW